MDFLSAYYGTPKPKRKAKGKSKPKARPMRQREDNIYGILGKTMEATVAIGLTGAFLKAIKK